MAKVPAHVRLRDWRKQQRLNQQAAAERVGVTQQTWSKLESGEGPFLRVILVCVEYATYGAVKAAEWA